MNRAAPASASAARPASTSIIDRVVSSAPEPPQHTPPASPRPPSGTTRGTTSLGAPPYVSTCAAGPGRLSKTIRPPSTATVWFSTVTRPSECGRADRARTHTETTNDGDAVTSTTSPETDVIAFSSCPENFRPLHHCSTQPTRIAADLNDCDHDAHCVAATDAVSTSPATMCWECAGTVPARTCLTSASVVAATVGVAGSPQRVPTGSTLSAFCRFVRRGPAGRPATRNARRSSGGARPVCLGELPWRGLRRVVAGAGEAGAGGGFVAA